eukprot:PITA_35891
MSSASPQYPLWKYVDRQKPPKGAGGTATIKCTLCQLEWKGSYTRVKAHFMQIARKGVDACTGDPNDPTRLPSAQKEQQKADGKASKEISRPSHNVTENDDSNEEELPFDDEVETGDEHVSVSTRASKSTTTQAHKKPKLGGLYDMFDVKGREGVDLAIARFFLACGIPFNAARSPYFEQMVRAINDGPQGYKAPGYENLRTVLVDKEKSRLERAMAPLKASWSVDGCSIVMDGWTDCRNRPLINIIVSSMSGPYFLRAIDCSGQEKNAMFLKDQLCDAIAEVGPSNVVQVIADAAPVCKAAGAMVQKEYKHIFWTPCVVHAMNNALKDIGKIEWIQELIENGRKIQMFICNHHQPQAIYRKYAKMELLKPADTRFATYYILLRRLVEMKEALSATVVSDMWEQWRLSTSDVALEVKRLILNDHFWVDAKFVAEIIEPICDMIRYADTDDPCLGEIYENMDSMCERIQTITDRKDPTLWPQLKEFIHGRWNKLNTPLHMAAYVVNPKWYDPTTGRRPPSQDREVFKGFLNAVKKIYGNTEEASDIRSQFAQFSRGQGVFGSHASLADRRKKKDPIDWWWLHGVDAPELQQFAIRLLGQVASSSSCERNWSTYAFIHSVKRNRLGSKKAENLVYIHNTLRLISRKDLGYKEGPFKRWDQHIDDASCVDEEIQPDGLIELPPIAMDEQEPEDESDSYLENMLAEDLSDVDDMDVEDMA